MIHSQLDQYLFIDIANQQLKLMVNGACTLSFTISTALNGVGEKEGSGCTPRGWHKVQAKIGDNQPVNSVFRGRRPTGEIYTPELGLEYPNRDWILTRIIWLKGCEIHKNLLGDVDTMRRYIYIHGTPDTNPMGNAQSHGCIRMHNSELINLYEQIPCYLPVYISEKGELPDLNTLPGQVQLAAASAINFKASSANGGV